MIKLLVLSVDLQWCWIEVFCLGFWFVVRDAGGVTRSSTYLVYENRYGCACTCCKFGGVVPV